MTYRPRSLFSFFLPAALTLFLMFALVYFYLLPEQYENLIQQKKEQIQGVVDNAWNIINYEYKRFEQGRISEEQAKENLYRIVEFLRWGPNDSNYLYLFTVQGRLLAHPYSPNLIGKNLNDVTEGKGRSLGKLLLGAAKRPNYPFVIYYWYKPNAKVMSRKLNCVRFFKPWNWVIGGGVYFDDIDAQNERQKSNTIIFFLTITIIIGVLLGIMVRRGLHEEVLRTQRERELRASEQKFRDIYDNTSVFIGLLDADGRLLDTNRTSTDFLQIHRDSVIGEYFWETPWWTHSPKQVDTIRRSYDIAVHNKQTQRFDTELVAPDGQELVIDFSLKPLFSPGGKIRNFIVEGVNVTEQRKTEEKLRQSTKLDAIGQLAGGIAHDFNNMLGAIMGCAEVLAQEIGKGTRLNKFTDLIINSAENAARLTNKLLAFSHKSKAVSTAIDAHECINDALEILERTIDKNIKITRRMEAEDTTIIGDPVQIQNAVINLGVNASHAMQGGGELTVSTSNTTLDQEACKELPFELMPGKFLRIEIEDTGTGIPKKYLDRIFEPFFTTKEVGEGTGLGLATVYGMAKEHHGAITVESKEGQGTKFIIHLPNEDVAIPLSKHDLLDEFSGQGCILVIDDEELLRTTAMSMLNQLGYDVLLAQDGQEGVQVFKENQGTIDLVITDMVMPRMSGLLCCQHIRELDPEVPVILSSGLSQHHRIDELKKQGVSAVVHKPYRMQDLAKAIHDSLMQKANKE